MPAQYQTEQKKSGGVFPDFLVLRVLLVLCGASSAWATDISFEAGVSAIDSNVINVDFIRDEAIELTESYHFRGTLRLDQPLTERLSITALAFQDPMLQRRILGRVNVTYGWFSFQVGPFIGIVNTPSALVSPGLSGYLGLTVPQIAFGSVRADATLLSSIDGYTSNQAEIRLGLYLPFFPALVPSASMDIIYVERREKGFTISRHQTRYALFLDTTGPENRYDIHLTIGYQELGWSVYHETESVMYQLNSIYGGVTIAYRLMPAWKVRIGGTLPIFSWITKENVDGLVPKNPLFFDFSVGFIWSGNLRKKR
ncbi:MAG: hypothetical protein LBG87_00910 [Spirochaetaceae bacterium]|jgi:hypothetical protein|nr:hypothetical protein [Spirochaetaceae bacterium]